MLDVILHHVAHVTRRPFDSEYCWFEAIALLNLRIAVEAGVL